MADRRSAVVIGGGFGGLAAAIRLQAGGCQVTLVEKRDQLGGRAYVYRDAGFTFDAGPTVITAPQALEELFALAGRRMSDYVELMPVEPFYRLAWEDGYRFDYGASLDETLAQIRAKSPADADGYRRFLSYSKEVFDEGYALVDVPFLSWRDMIRVSPQLVRLKAYRSVYSRVSRFIRDPHLRQAFSFHSLLVGGNPFTASSIYTLIHYLERNWGVTFPRGGTGALVGGMARLFTELGGRVELGAEVGSIETGERGEVRGVRTLGGSFHAADVVVSDADVMHTYGSLLKSTESAQSERRRLSNMRYSMSLFLIYFGTKRQYPDMAHHTVVFGPRYRELLEDIFHRGVLADDFSLYLHAPTRTDPSLAPPGCESFYVLSPVPNLELAPIDWKKEGPRYADRILGYLEKHHLPGLRESIVTRRIFTPEDFRDELNSYRGAAFSLEPVLTQSAYFRVANRCPRVPGLYFVGAGTHPGAGVPGVINSAKATARLVLEDVARA
jgi:phytoene desaturase